MVADDARSERRLATGAYAQPTGRQGRGLDHAPGTALLLPADAESLANGPWQQLHEVSFTIENEGAIIRGVVPLDGLHAALQSLRASCAAR